MRNKASGALALMACAIAATFAVAPAGAQTAAERQFLQACGGNMAMCANLAQQLQGYQAAGGNAAGMNQVLNAAAAAANAARGQTVNPSAYGASSVVTPTNSVGAIAASQQYGQCVQAAGQNAQLAQACMRYLPPEWAALAQQAQNAYLANPAAANAAAGQALANAQAMAAGNAGQARALPGGNPFASAMSAMTGQAANGGGLAALAAQAAQAAQATQAGRGGAAPAAGLGGYGNAAAIQAQYVACIQASGGNPAVAAACSQPAMQAYGAMPGVATAAAAYNPVNNANAIAAAAGGYQACVMSVGVTNAAGIQACQQRFFGGGGAAPMPGGQPAAPATAAPYNPFAAMGR